jgi:uncharacterized protein YkwD
VVRVIGAPGTSCRGLRYRGATVLDGAGGGPGDHRAATGTGPDAPIDGQLSCAEALRVGTRGTCMTVSNRALFAILLGLVVGCGGGSDGSAPSESQGDGQTADERSGENADGPIGCADIAGHQDALAAALSAARAQPRTCGNGEYGAAGPVTAESALYNAARTHSADMAQNNFFEHTGSDGLDVGHRVINAGYTWSGVAENIAAGQQTMTQVVEGWLDSPGHCANIMNASLDEIGGACVASASSQYGTYWTLVLATPR